MAFLHPPFIAENWNFSPRLLMKATVYTLSRNWSTVPSTENNVGFPHSLSRIDGLCFPTISYAHYSIVPVFLRFPVISSVKFHPFLSPRLSLPPQQVANAVFYCSAHPHMVLSIILEFLVQLDCPVMKNDCCKQQCTLLTT
ncbi:hypothetical protein CRM22_000804 [Opisthorchis felineus]|uniref:Uncharacterized protein n=1 Tax=Opisthorchis felineus TaxID=147828 RepID=A0A4S2MDF5_OPIFE|nr:hypothetical protein CRM22_000804 [Opisthorchis felineus]